jgi:hypothetical protein
MPDSVPAPFRDTPPPEDHAAIHRMPRPPRTWAERLGIALAVVLVICGLAVVGFVVLMAVGLSQWGDNK